MLAATTLLQNNAQAAIDPTASPCIFFDCWSIAWTECGSRLSILLPRTATCVVVDAGRCIVALSVETNIFINSFICCIGSSRRGEGEGASWGRRDEGNNERAKGRFERSSVSRRSQQNYWEKSGAWKAHATRGNQKRKSRNWIQGVERLVKKWREVGSNDDKIDIWDGARGNPGRYVNKSHSPIGFVRDSIVALTLFLFHK